jgi:hypothetical protein
MIRSIWTRLRAAVAVNPPAKRSASASVSLGLIS